MDNGMMHTKLLKVLKAIYNDESPRKLSELYSDGVDLLTVAAMADYGLVTDGPSIDGCVHLTEAGRKILWFMQGCKL